ncbi:MAG: DUF3726 domain-containing protein [Pseudomonadota bacterium]
MDVSLNEVEAMAKKAARGAGYPWGLAEEAARATRWLCAHDLEGCAALADLLDRIDGANLADAAPHLTNTGAHLTDTGWIANGDWLCPIQTGAAMADRAVDITSQPFRLGPVAAPLLLLPFAGLVVQASDGTVTVSWDGATATTDGADVTFEGSQTPHCNGAVVKRGGTLATPLPRRARAAPSSHIWQRLNNYAHRTYAPATEESRQRGAGSGGSDTD